MPEVFRKEASGDIEGASAAAAAAAEVGRRFATPTWWPSQRTHRGSS